MFRSCRLSAPSLTPVKVLWLPKQQVSCAAERRHRVPRTHLESYVAIMYVNMAHSDAHKFVHPQFEASSRSRCLELNPKQTDWSLCSVQLLDWAMFSCGGLTALIWKMNGKVKRLGHRIII